MSSQSPNHSLKSNLLAIISISDILRTSFGPNGYDKLFYHSKPTPESQFDSEKDIIITNDGCTIIQHLPISNMMGLMLRELSEAQDRTVGDGTTSVIVLSGSFSRSALSLLEDQLISLSPHFIRHSFQLGLEFCLHYCASLSPSLPSTYYTSSSSSLSSSSSSMIEDVRVKGGEVCISPLALFVRDFLKITSSTHNNDNNNNNHYHITNHHHDCSNNDDNNKGGEDDNNNNNDKYDGEDEDDGEWERSFIGRVIFNIRDDDEYNKLTQSNNDVYTYLSRSKSKTNCHSLRTLRYIARTVLNSKLLQSHKHSLAELCLQSVLSSFPLTLFRSLLHDRVDDRDRRLEVMIGEEIHRWYLESDWKIRCVYYEGGDVQLSSLYYGHVLYSSSFSHSSSPSRLEDVRVVIISGAIDTPKLKSTFEITLHESASLSQIADLQTNYFTKFLGVLKKYNINLVICQQQIAQPLVQLLFENQITAIGWVSATDLDLLSSSSLSPIHSQIADLINNYYDDENKSDNNKSSGDDDDEVEGKVYGYFDRVEMMVMGNSGNRVITFENFNRRRGNMEKWNEIRTIIVRGGNKIACEEAVRALTDCLRVIRHFLLQDGRYVSGGGSFECYLFTKMCKEFLPMIPNHHFLQRCLREWGRGILGLVFAIAKNCAISPVIVDDLLATHFITDQPHLGLNLNDNENKSGHHYLDVVEPLALKLTELTLSTHFINLILRIK